MGVEIERKFLVEGDGWRSDDRLRIRQGYLCRSSVTVRVRRTDASGTITLKGPSTGLSRAEFEYEIPVDDVDELLQLAGPVIDKTRHRTRVGDHLWEIDEFHGANAPLVLAEVELRSEDERVVLPPWAGREVSTDPRFRNAALADNPYGSWPPEERDR